MDQRPLVTARFTEGYPIRVTVLGQVAKPGAYSILNTTTFQGAVSEAGGFTPGAQLSEVKLIRPEAGKIHNQTVNMEIFYLKGDPTYLPTLKDGDTIMVPGNPVLTTVKVVGSVKSPGSYEVAFRTGLLDVIFMAGGPTDEANLNQVKLISLAGQTQREIKINFDDLSKNSMKIIPLVVPGDVVYVPPQKHTWKKMVTVLRDLSAFAALYLLIERR
jgi:protein involved in polysaccharide export with SLBB domain